MIANIAKRQSTCAAAIVGLVCGLILASELHALSSVNCSV
ncbi:putative membrane protein [Collimonas arenae]|nr:putative membrane protein [Collimonas arenae]